MANTFTGIPSTDTDVDSPVTQSLCERWANNVLAIAEGDASAPRVSTKALDTVAVSAQNGGGGGAQGIDHTITWSTEDLDTKNYFDHTVGVFTPLVAGKYEVIFSGKIAGGGGGTLKARVTKNSTHIIDKTLDDGDSFTFPTIIDMNGTTDTLNMGIRRDTTVGSVSISNAFLTIKAVGR